MSERDDSVTIRQMLDAAQKAIQFTQHADSERFKRDELKILAITRLLEILGEAARRVSQELRSAHPEIEWREIIGARDRIIHGYDTVDLDRVWRICREDLPALTKKLEKVLEEI
jgi:uncharacterized protein with HEPN domain